MILGINYSGYHDSAVALLNGSGKIIYAASEERFSRIKKDGHFPHNCLSRINLNEVTHVAVPYLAKLPPEPEPDPFFSGILLSRNRGLSGYPPEWRERLDSLGKNLIFVDHHLSHAACGFFLSGFEDALIVTADYGATNCLWNMGIYKATPNDISPLHSASCHHFYPLCALYSDVTALLGFRPNVHEGKITGLAAYGEDDPVCEEKLWAIFCEIHNRAIPLYYWTGWLDETSYPSLEINPALAAHYRAKLSEFNDKQIAHAAQRITEKKLTQLIGRLREEYASDSIILSGGLFANVRLNLEVKRQGFKNIFVCPPMGDEGLAIGAAVLARKELYGSTLKNEPVRDLFLGTATLGDAKDKLAKLGMVYSTPESLSLKIATLLSEGKIVALVKEGMEFGPRSLGHRSILYQATDPSVNDWLNKRLKRTEFMPFAPIVQADHAAEYFDPVELGGAEHTAQFMTICFHCRDIFKAKCPAVVHVDGTARPQLVDRQSQPELHSILSEYERLTGLPALINTSFNVHDEPIVASVADAVVAFFQSGLDYLVIDQYLISREENQIWREAARVMPGQALQVHKSIHRSAMAVFGNHIADLDAAKTSLESRVNGLQEEMVGKIETFRQEIAAKNRELTELGGLYHSETHRLQTELARATDVIGRHETDRAAMLMSFSWRLTAPFRAMGRQLLFLRKISGGALRRLTMGASLFREATPEGSLVGHLEAPHHGSHAVLHNLLTVSGWLFSKDVPVRKISVEVNEQEKYPVTYGYNRPDVYRTFPDFPGAKTSGFSGVCFPDAAKRGKLTITVWATLENGEKKRCFTRRVKAGGLSGLVKKPSFLFALLQSSTRKAWRAFREGRLPISLSLWIKHFRRHYDLMLVNSQAARFQNDPAYSLDSVDPYLRWINTNRLTVKLLARMKVDAERLRVAGPIISIIVPVYNTPRAFLEEMIGSVISQIYPKWELCLADDASTQPHVREVLEKMAAKDDRIRIVHRNRNGHIVEATNSALGIASGEYVVLLDHDDVLPPDAILHIAECISCNPHVDWIYTDEDKIDKNGRHFDPQFKGAWNPEMAITHNFTHHLTAIRKSLVERVGGMRKGFEGAQDLDLFLRVAENTTADRIRHVPHVCYHWRSHGGSTASHGTQKSYIFDSAYRAINDALKRRALRAEPFLPPVAERHGMCLYQLKWHADPPATRKVTIVIPTKDRIDLLKRCISSLQKTVDDRFVKLLIVDDRSSEPRTLEYLGELEREHVLQCRVIHPKTNDEKFNYARLMNEAARHVDTPYMLQLNNDVEAIKSGWLEEMMGWMSIDNVAVVGARLLYPDGKIQHGGVVIGPRGGLADHQFHLLPQDEVGYLALPHTARNVSAVTGACMLTSTDFYRELNGFDENNLAVEYNDVDFCLRVLTKGKRIVYTPQATLLHLTSASRGMDYDPSEHINFVQRYHKFRDPFFNENIQIDSMRMTISPRHFAHADRIGKLKVLLITHNLNLGGAPIVAYEFAKHFVTQGGYQVSLISPEDGPLRERYEALNIPIHILHDFPLLQETNAAELQSYLKSLGDLIDVRSFDLVVCNTLTTFWGLEMARMFNVPSIWHIHESTRIEVYNVFFEKSVRPLLCSCFMNANRVVFQAEATRRLFHDIEARGNFCTIPGGVPLERINAFRASHGKKRMRAKYGIDENCTVVTLIGTTCERKGQHVFLEAIQELEKEYPNGLPDDLVFIMVGAIKGPYLDFLHERREELGLGKVRIFDETKEIYDFYVLSDIFVCASFEESFPMVVLLAMAFELKIVSTNVFGIPEIISDGQDGRLVKPGNPTALGNAIYICLNNPELSDRMARNAYAKVYRLFDNDKFLERHLLLTKEVSVEECAGAGFVATASEYAQPVSASVS